jgi:glutamine cyclotransferase
MHLLLSAIASLLAVSSALAAASPAPSQSPGVVPFLGWEEVSRRAHDNEAFTQGLVLDSEGRLFESTGLHERSSVREVDPLTGSVLRSRPQPDRQFSEGLALVGDELIQLTWQDGLARRYEADTFEIVRRYRYRGQGWGLCYDGDRLVMSNGSDILSFRDAETFEQLGSVSVTVLDEPLALLNELECVDGQVWANVLRTDAIVRIDPADGRVTGVLDMTGLMEPHPTEANAGAVLNGIAYDAEAGTFLVTGKLWPELIEIRVLEAEAVTEDA